MSARWVLVLVAAAMLFAGCERRSPPAPGEPADRFWTWFAGEAATLRKGDSTESMETVNRHLEALGFQVNAEIELDEPALIVITADGDRALFPEVERLVSRAPSIPGWRIQAFRQRMEIAGSKLQMNGRELDVDRVRVVAVPAGGKLDLRVYLPGYVPDRDTIVSLGFIAFDHVLGERDVETRIGVIDWFAAEAAPPEARPLTDLPAVLDRAFPPSP